MTGAGLSDNSRRIARNTIYLYLRMLVMLLIGLVTYRVILRSLGVQDYGVYGAVGGIVTMFMLVMNTVTSAISRYITVGLGKGDPARLKKTFGTSLAVMAGFCLLIVLLSETLGLWYLHHHMKIPLGRMGAADVVLQTSVLILLVNLLSVPYTAVLTAHEQMDAYALISILEGVLKLLVACGVWFAPWDKLQVYAWLLLAVNILVRLAYMLYARRHFAESRASLCLDVPLMKEMGAFAGWNFLGSGVYMVNTQGINQLMNHFFGVGMNAARGVADKVEQVVRQFATNIALAMNPQLTKSYVSGNRSYAYELACKGSKYYFWVLLALSFPFFTDAETILRLWVGELPKEAALFTKLTLLGFLVDFTPNTLIILEQAQGQIKRFYLVSSAVGILVFPITYLLYRAGFPAWVGYGVFIGIYLLKDAVMLLLAHQDTGLPVGKYLRDAVLPMVSATLLPALAVWGVTVLVPVCWWRFLVVAAVGVVSMAGALWLYGLTPGEKAFLLFKLRRA